MAKKKERLYYTDTVSVRSGLGGGLLIKMEQKAYGYVYQGSSQHEEFAGLDDNYKPQWKPYKLLYFCRHSPYTKNLLFKLSEWLMNIISFFRRLLLSFLPLAIVGLIAAAIIFMDNAPDLVGALFGIVVGVYAGLIAATILFSLLGILWRKVFDIDRKLAENLEANGYDPDSFD